MTADQLIIELTKNQKIIESILSDVSDDFIHFSTDEQSWSPLIVLCHLIDEEKEDFRARVQHLVEHNESAPFPIDPEGWVTARDYKSQDFDAKLSEWISERNISLNFLSMILPEHYDNGFEHSHFGRFTVGSLLDNWLAHDLLHIRQLTRIRYQYLSSLSTHSMEYAGQWG